MTTDSEIKRQVREFYNQVGWQTIGEGLYQNARYEDLRPVSQEYIHRCHLRVARQLAPEGGLMLDAGSGPIQYPEYLDYSRGYTRRVCADISRVALLEARERIGDHGLFVVADIANLPFRRGAFDALVSLHTIHHLPLEEHSRAYEELYRVLAPGKAGVVVNGWANSPFKRLIRAVTRSVRWLRGALGRRPREKPQAEGSPTGPEIQAEAPTGTYVHKGDAAWLKEHVGAHIPLEIRVWRSVNVRFLRTFVHRRLGGRVLLQLIYRLEEALPRFFGENGVYPLIVMRKPAGEGER